MLPNLTDKFIQGSSTAGTVKGAGLPNITGGSDTAISAIKYDKTTAETWSGAIGTANSYSGSLANPSGNIGSSGYRPLLFDASKSNAIYGKSSTVQPPALTMKYAIYTGVTSNHKWVRQS